MKNYLIFTLCHLLVCSAAFAQSTPGCGTVPTPEEVQYLNQTEPLRAAFSDNIQSREPIQIPIVNHIVRQSNGTGGLTTQQLAAAIQGLNDFYAQVQIEFFECEPAKFINNSTWFNFDSGNDFTVYNTNNIAGALNIYYFNNINNGTICGYTNLPPGPDRIMMANGCTTSGTTLIHEVGHYLALYHTHGTSNCGTTDELVNGSNCSFAGDRVCDTPADPNLYANCQTPLVNSNCQYVGTATDANGQSYNPQTNNIMSYSVGFCRNIFTQGQFDRVVFSAMNDRDYLFCNNCTDNDNDGVCANEDCDDNNASIPTTPGTTCNDNDPNTINDVIQADGCTCAGTLSGGGGSYCASQGNSTQYEFIQSVNFGGINNTSGNNNGYADYTAQTATVNKGASYNITLTPGFASTAYNEFWKVWIDFNQDGDFDDAGEEVLNQSSNATISASVTIPSSATSGSTGMRISMKYGAAPTSCEVFNEGEVEDYSVAIGGGNPCDNQGGDNDNDGVCANEDCDDNNASIPTTPGTPCNDNNPNTIDDVIQADGCTCAGTSPCANQGGDNDNDGVCANEDCDDNNASIPTTPGIACNDNDPNTVNDVIQADGCTCAGTPTGGGSGYCASQGNSTQYEFIESVSFASINNTSGNNNGYADYTAQTASVDKGSSYNITLTPGFVSGAYNEFWKVWIDFNQDGDFDDAGEEVLNQSSNAAISASVTIPSSATSGTTGMRISMKYGATPISCETFNEGEVEDYSVAIGGNPCDNQGGDNDNDGVCANEDCDDNNPNIPTTPGIACNDNDPNTIDDVIQADGCTCAGTPINIEYCASQANNTDYEYIQNVNTASINNTSGDNGGYADFTSQTATVNAGTSYVIILTPGFVSSAYTEYWKVWIDFNQDGDFDDSGEEVLSQSSNAAINSVIAIPSSAQAGTTRMRVSMKYGGEPLSCETFTYGEVEDYTVNILNTDIAGEINNELVPDIRNYPNPFSHRTSIEFSISDDSPVTLKVYDMTGRRVATLLDNEVKGIGQHRITFNGSEHSSGIYIYIIQAGEFTSKGKMNIVK